MLLLLLPLLPLLQLIQDFGVPLQLRLLSLLHLRLLHQLSLLGTLQAGQSLQLLPQTLKNQLLDTPIFLRWFKVQLSMPQLLLNQKDPLMS